MPPARNRQFLFALAVAIQLTSSRTSGAAFNYYDHNNRGNHQQHHYVPQQHYYHYDFDAGAGGNNFHASAHLSAAAPTVIDGSDIGGGGIIDSHNRHAATALYHKNQQPQQLLLHDVAALHSKTYQQPQPQHHQSQSALPVTALLLAHHNAAAAFHPFLHNPFALPVPVPLPPPPPPLPSLLPSLENLNGASALAQTKSAHEIMVDISNRLAFAVLNAHTEPHNVRRRRAQNFAFSPCGLTSVLIALWEGAAGGGGGNEIYRAMRLPWDRDVVRDGVRDMHKRLREYFYADENLLDGLSLNRDNVTIRPQYEAVLRFYGYDLNPSLAAEEMMNMATTMFHVAATAMPPSTTPTQPMPSKSTPGTTEIRSVTATAVTQPLNTVIVTEKPTITTSQSPVTTTTEMVGMTTELPETTANELTTMTEQPIVTTMPPTTTTKTETSITTTTTTMSTTTTTTLPPTTTTTPPPETTTQRLTTTAQPATLPPIETTTIFVPLIAQRIPAIATTTPSPTTIMDTTTVFVPLIAQRTSPLVYSTTQLPTTVDTTTIFVPLIAQRVPATLIQTTTPSPYVFTFKPPTTTSAATATSTQRTSRAAFTTTMTTTTTDETMTTVDEDDETSTLQSTTTEELVDDITDGSTMPTLEPISTTTVEEEEAPSTTPAESITTESPRQRRARFRAVPTTPLFNRQARRLTATTPTPPNASNKRVKKFLHHHQHNSAPRHYFDMLAEPFSRLVQNAQLLKQHRTNYDYPLYQAQQAESGIDVNRRDQGFYYATPYPPAALPQSYAPYSSFSLQPSAASAPFQSNANAYAGTDSFAPHGTAALFEYPVAAPPTTEATRLSQSFAGLSFSSYAASADDSTHSHAANNKIDNQQIPANTTMLPFHIDRRLVVSAPFRILNAALRLGYAPSVQASVLELPLETDNYVLLLLLPDVAFDLNGLMQRMQAANRVAPTVREMRAAMRRFWIRATVPLVQLKGSAVLTEDMMKLGVKDIFEPARADFTPMTDETGIYAKHIEQLITLNIQTAAADDSRPSSVNAADRQQQQPIEVNVQQPFVFCIVDAQTDLIIMIGQIVNPLSSRIL